MGRRLHRKVILKVIALVQVIDGGWVEVIPMEMGQKVNKFRVNFGGQIY